MRFIICIVFMLVLLALTTGYPLPSEISLEGFGGPGFGNAIRIPGIFETAGGFGINNKDLKIGVSDGGNDGNRKDQSNRGSPPNNYNNFGYPPHGYPPRGYPPNDYFRRTFYYNNYGQPPYRRPHDERAFALEHNRDRSANDQQPSERYSQPSYRDDRDYHDNLVYSKH